MRCKVPLDMPSTCELTTSLRMFSSARAFNEPMPLLSGASPHPAVKAVWPNPVRLIRRDRLHRRDKRRHSLIRRELSLGSARFDQPWSELSFTGPQGGVRSAVQAGVSARAPSLALSLSPSLSLSLSLALSLSRSLSFLLSLSLSLSLSLFLSLPPSLPLSLSRAHTHANAHARTHSRTRTHTHAHAHTEKPWRPADPAPLHSRRRPEAPRSGLCMYS